MNLKIKTEMVADMLKSARLAGKTQYVMHRYLDFDHIVTVTMRLALTLKTGMSMRVARIATRRALAELSDEALRDIGRTRAEARHQAGLPWWR